MVHETDGGARRCAEIKTRVRPRKLPPPTVLPRSVQAPYATLWAKSGVSHGHAAAKACRPEGHAMPGGE